MHIVFTDEENDWIDKIPFVWKVKEGAPDSIRESIEKKFLIMKKHNEYARGEQNVKNRA